MALFWGKKEEPVQPATSSEPVDERYKPLKLIYTKNENFPTPMSPWADPDFAFMFRDMYQTVKDLANENRRLHNRIDKLEKSISEKDNLLSRVR